MENGSKNIMQPGDAALVDEIVNQLKSQGIFDQWRKDCLADVDTKPAYQNLQTRVESTVARFLEKQLWNEKLNKNQLRERLRKHILSGGFLDKGLDRITDQVVDPKVNRSFLPIIQDTVYTHLGIENPYNKKEETAQNLMNLSLQQAPGHQPGLFHLPSYTDNTKKEEPISDTEMAIDSSSSSSASPTPPAYSPVAGGLPSPKSDYSPMRISPENISSSPNLPSPLPPAAKPGLPVDSDSDASSMDISYSPDAHGNDGPRRPGDSNQAHRLPTGDSGVTVPSPPVNATTSALSQISSSESLPSQPSPPGETTPLLDEHSPPSMPRTPPEPRPPGDSPPPPPSEEIPPPPEEELPPPPPPIEVAPPPPLSEPPLPPSGEDEAPPAPPANVSEPEPVSDEEMPVKEPIVEPDEASRSSLVGSGKVKDESTPSVSEDSDIEVRVMNTSVQRLAIQNVTTVSPDSVSSESLVDSSPSPPRPKRSPVPRRHRSRSPNARSPRRRRSRSPETRRRRSPGSPRRGGRSPQRRYSPPRRRSPAPPKASLESMLSDISDSPVDSVKNSPSDEGEIESDREKQKKATKGDSDSGELSDSSPEIHRSSKKERKPSSSSSSSTTSSSETSPEEDHRRRPPDRSDRDRDRDDYSRRSYERKDSGRDDYSRGSGYYGSSTGGKEYYRGDVKGRQMAGEAEIVRDEMEEHKSPGSSKENITPDRIDENVKKPILGEKPIMEMNVKSTNTSGVSKQQFAVMHAVLEESVVEQQKKAVTVSEFPKEEKSESVKIETKNEEMSTVAEKVILKGLSDEKAPVEDLKPENIEADVPKPEAKSIEGTNTETPVDIPKDADLRKEDVKITVEKEKEKGPSERKSGSSKRDPSSKGRSSDRSSSSRHDTRHSSTSNDRKSSSSSRRDSIKGTSKGDRDNSDDRKAIRNRDEKDSRSSDSRREKSGSESRRISDNKDRRSRSNEEKNDRRSSKSSSSRSQSSGDKELKKDSSKSSEKESEKMTSPFKKPKIADNFEEMRIVMRERKRMKEMESKSHRGKEGEKRKQNSEVATTNGTETSEGSISDSDKNPKGLELPQGSRNNNDAERKSVTDDTAVKAAATNPITSKAEEPPGTVGSNLRPVSSQSLEMPDRAKLIQMAMRPPAGTRTVADIFAGKSDEEILTILPEENEGIANHDNESVVPALDLYDFEEYRVWGKKTWMTVRIEDQTYSLRVNNVFKALHPLDLMKVEAPKEEEPTGKRVRKVNTRFAEDSAEGSRSPAQTKPKTPRTKSTSPPHEPDSAHSDPAKKKRKLSGEHAPSAKKPKSEPTEIRSPVNGNDSKNFVSQFEAFVASTVSVPPKAGSAAKTDTSRAKASPEKSGSTPVAKKARISEAASGTPNKKDGVPMRIGGEKTKVTRTPPHTPLSSPSASATGSVEVPVQQEGKRVRKINTKYGDDYLMVPKSYKEAGEERLKPLTPDDDFKPKNTTPSGNKKVGESSGGTAPSRTFSEGSSGSDSPKSATGYTVSPFVRKPTVMIPKPRTGTPPIKTSPVYEDPPFLRSPKPDSPPVHALKNDADTSAQVKPDVGRSFPAKATPSSKPCVSHKKGASTEKSKNGKSSEKQASIKTAVSITNQKSLASVKPPERRKHEGISIASSPPSLGTVELNMAKQESPPTRADAPLPSPGVFASKEGLATSRRKERLEPAASDADDPLDVPENEEINKAQKSVPSNSARDEGALSEEKEKTASKRTSSRKAGMKSDSDVETAEAVGKAPRRKSAAVIKEVGKVPKRGGTSSPAAETTPARRSGRKSEQPETITTAKERKASEPTKKNQQKKKSESEESELGGTSPPRDETPPKTPPRETRKTRRKSDSVLEDRIREETPPDSDTDKRESRKRKASVESGKSAEIGVATPKKQKTETRQTKASHSASDLYKQRQTRRRPSRTGGSESTEGAED